ncbi:cadherin-like beta sandwich domain-containing protein [Paenibacillus sp. 2TAB26]|uniref:cadherin-like beta sandwich domain-containing protein n=1 Tax=Paenibacillus sp. 2TAB26 TaxID=3233005 RepID=UPI003F983BCB
MFKKRISGSMRVLLKGYMVRLLLGLMVFSLFSSSLALPAFADAPNVGPDGSAGWTYCADERTTCGFEGTKEVRYWGNDGSYSFNTKIATNSIACSNDVFGDPAAGTPKKCYYRNLQLDSGEMTKVVSNYNKTLTVTFNVYAKQAGTLEDLKSKITIKKTSDGDFTALDADDTVTNATSSTLQINFKDNLVGAANAIKIDAGAFLDSDNTPYGLPLEITAIMFTPPTVIADTTDNNNANDIELTFADDSEWRQAITAVKDGSATLAMGTEYTVNNGKITIKAGVLAKGNHNINISASGFPDVGVSQLVRKLYPGAGAGTISDPYLIETSDHLNEVRNNMDSGTYYKLVANINLNGFANWEPIGNDIEPFKGYIDGSGYPISNLKIDTNYAGNKGLFGSVNAEGTLTNMVLEDVNIIGQSSNVGGLAGTNYGKISNSSVTGTVQGSTAVGGLVGYSENGTIQNSMAAVNVSGVFYIGGLVGFRQYGSISNSYATGSVSGASYVGGLIGVAQFGSVSNSYATGSVSGSSLVGGLNGNVAYDSTNNSYYDSQTTHQGDTGGGIGKSTAEMQTKSHFNSWNFNTEWYILPGKYPQLWAFVALAQGTDGGSTKLIRVAEGMEYSFDGSTYIPITGMEADNLIADAGDKVFIRAAADILSTKTLTVSLANIKSGSAPTTSALTAGTSAGTTKLTGVTSAMEYKVGSGSYSAITGISMDNIVVNAGEKISVRLAAVMTQPASLDQTLTVTRENIKSAAAPTTGTLEPGTIGETTKLNGITSAMEYKVNNNLYERISETSIDNIAVKENDTISVRITATALQPESEPQILTVQSNVRNPKSADASLSELTLGGVTLSPTFDSETMEYTSNVANNVTSTSVTAIKGTATATIIAADLGVKQLSVGENVITVHVTAEDGITKNEYTVTVTRALSSDATLSTLTLSGVTLSEAFASDTLTYTANAANHVTSTTVAASKSNAAATITASDLGLKQLSVGENVITVHVTAEDGSTQYYTVIVTRATSPDATLSALTLSGVTLSPSFASGTLTYTANVANHVTSTTVAASKSDATATITASDLGLKQLSVGENVITVHVTAEDGSTNSYTVTVTRAKNSDATLSALTLSGVTLSPAFASGTLTYTANVANDVTSTTVAASKSTATAAITAADLGLKQLTVGENVITVHVTAEDGSTNSYTVTVTRAASSNARLSSLTLSGVSFSPTFDSETLEYTADVANDVMSTTVAAIESDATATITASNLGSKQLSVGENTITVQVTAEDGSTKKYTVIVTRAQSSDATLSELTLNGVTLSPKFVNGTFAYTGNVAYSVTSTTITATKSAATATINETDLGFKQLSVGENTFIVHVTAEDGVTKKQYNIIVTRAKEVVSGGGGLPVPTPSPTPTPVPTPKQIPSPTPTISLVDISRHWAEDNIKQAISNGIVTGYPDGTFRPNHTVTRGEFAVMLMNLLKPQEAGAELSFTDTTKIPAWAQKAIAQAVQEGIINGYEDGTFRPNAEITRAEMAVILAKALGQSTEANAATSFADDNDIPAWARASVAYVKQAGIVKGKGNNEFAPQDHATRAEAVTVLLNILASRNK